MGGDVAQQPGLMEWLGDNEFTRGWSDLAARALGPVDGMMASDADLRSALARQYGARPEVRGEMLQSMGVAGVADEAAALQQVIDLAAQNGVRLTPEEAAQQLFRDALAKDVGREQLQKGMSGYGPGLPVSQAGQVAHAVLGNPAAAYGIPLAGAGVAALGVDGVLRAQQQAEKESMLPLS